MRLTPSDKIQRAIARMQTKLFDTLIQTLGTGGTNTFLISITEDKYKNTETILLDYKPIYCLIDFPGEIPLTYDTNTTTESNQTLHMYDILPIRAFFKTEDNVKKGNIVLYKVKMADNNFNTIPLQLIDLNATATISNVVFVQWTVAPITDYSLTQDPAFVNILEKFKETDLW